MMNKTQLIAQLKTLVPMLDDKYQYSDCHKTWKRQNRLHQQVREIEEQLAGIDGFPSPKIEVIE
jgi:hypothetical protein